MQKNPNPDTAPLSVHEEALRLYRLQRNRVATDFNIEKSIKKNLTSLSNEIRIAGELLRLIHESDEGEVTAADSDFWSGVEDTDD